MFRKMYVIPKNDPASGTCETLPQYTMPASVTMPEQRSAALQPQAVQHRAVW